jgi:drug/metabolite transporter (DMT)-like permease
MRQLEGFHITWEVWVGTFLSVVGIVLIGVGGSEMIDNQIRPAMYVAGFIAFLGGAFLIWRDLIASVRGDQC